MQHSWYWGKSWNVEMANVLGSFLIYQFLQLAKRSMNSSPCQACLGRWHCIFWGRQAQRWHRWTMKVKGHRDLLSGLGTPCAHGGSCQKLGYRCVPQHLKHLQRDSQICTKHCRIHCKFSWKLLFKSPLHIWRSDGILWTLFPMCYLTTCIGTPEHRGSG